jgi:hypothetical protein
MKTKQKKPENQPEPRGRGRPHALTDDDATLKTLSGLARIQCTTKEAAAVLGVSKQTFFDFLDRSLKARQAWEFGQETGRASLRRTQFNLAEKNAAMAIWLGKQWLDQKDRKEVEVGSPGDFDKLDAEQLREYISREAQALGVGHRPIKGAGRGRAAGEQLN